MPQWKMLHLMSVKRNFPNSLWSAIINQKERGTERVKESMNLLQSMNAPENNPIFTQVL